MSNRPEKNITGSNISASRINSIDKWISLLLKVFLAIGVVIELLQGNWLNAAATSGIIVVAFIPMLVGYRFHVSIPAEFEVLAVLFVYASLFLGEVQDFYLKYWWWDIFLHMGSGLILGIFGFLLVYVMNEHEDLELHMKPSFVALFTFMFSIGIGAIWEIFEFTLDQTLGMTTQGNSLVDTMSDLIIDGIGALIISLLGYSYLRKPRVDSFLERWIQHFITLNQWYFSRK
jgi:hypothetical protein